LHSDNRFLKANGFNLKLILCRYLLLIFTDSMRFPKIIIPEEMLKLLSSD
jgi:hypothetical protein